MAGTDPCWSGFEQRGTKEKDGKTVPNCVKADEVEKAIADAAWRVDCLRQRMDSCEHRADAGSTKERLRAMMQKYTAGGKEGTAEYKAAYKLYFDVGGKSTEAQLQKALEDLEWRGVGRN